MPLPTDEPLVSELGRSLEDLRRLGLYLRPDEVAAAAAHRRARMNTRVYPLMRAAGFHMLLVAIVIHDAAVFGAVHWITLLVYAAVVEAYLLLSWLALRRWFLRFPRMAGWDLADLFFVADLVLWAVAIHLTGGMASLLWPLPLLRVADHHPVPRVWVFAHLAPVTYAGVMAWGALVDGQTVAWGVEAAKLMALYGAGLYIALTSGPSRRLREQRGVALGAAAALLADLTERSRRLEEVNRSRGSILARIRTELRQPLVRIAGFSSFLLREEVPPDRFQRDYLERIRRQSRSALRLVDDLTAADARAPRRPRLSLSGLLQQAAALEAHETDAWREAASLELPPADVPLHADRGILIETLRHLLAAARHFGGGTPAVEVRADPATGLGTAVVIRCAAAAGRPVPGIDLTNPLAGAAVGDQVELAARLELDLARSLGEGEGYRLTAESTDERLTLTLHLR